MKDQPELFALIQGMTQSEKRYFSRFASLHSGRADGEYYQLFQRLVKMRQYDASVVKAEFGKHTEQLKRQLFGKLLTALRLFHEHEETEMQAWSMYHNSQLLERKHILRSAQRERVRAKSILATNKLPTLELHIWEQEVSQEVITASPERLEQILGEYSARSKVLIEEARGVASYTNLLIEVEILNRKFEGTRSESELHLIDRYLDQYSLGANTNAVSPREKLIFSFCNGLGNYLRCDFQASARHFDVANTILKLHPFLADQDPIMRVRIIADRALAHFHAGNRNKFSESMQELRTMNAESGHMKEFVRDVTLILELMDLNREKKFSEAIRKLRESHHEDNLTERSDLVTQEEIYFVFQEVTALWGAGELKKASARLSHFTNGRRKFMKDDAYVTARIVYLLLRFELEDESSTLSELRSVKTLLVKKKKYYRVERSLLQFVSTMMTKNTTGERRRTTRKFSHELTELRALPFERNAFLYFDFQTWAKTYESQL